MRFAESAIASIDISPSTAEVGPPFAQALQDVLREVDLSSPIELIVFFPTIICPTMGSMPDKITYKRSEPSVFIKINIDHGAWASGDRLTRLDLYTDALKCGIHQLKESKLSAADRDRLLTAIDGARLRIRTAQN